jgi:hypothetical protein
MADPPVRLRVLQVVRDHLRAELGDAVPTIELDWQPWTRLKPDQAPALYLAPALEAGAVEPDEIGREVETLQAALWGYTLGPANDPAGILEAREVHYAAAMNALFRVEPGSDVTTLTAKLHADLAAHAQNGAVGIARVDGPAMNELIEPPFGLWRQLLVLRCHVTLGAL